MAKWADFLISAVNYNKNHLISKAKRHTDSEHGIDAGIIVDRLTIASDIMNGLSYMTIYNKESSWQQGKIINSYKIHGDPFVRIDGNKVDIDNLGELPEVESDSTDTESEDSETEAEDPPPQSEQISSNTNSTKLEELQKNYLARLNAVKFQPKSEPQPESPRGSLPKNTNVELPQELDLAPEPIVDESQPEQDSGDNKKSRKELLEEYESDYLERLDTEEPQPESPRGSLPKGFETSFSEPDTEEPQPESPRGSLPKGFETSFSESDTEEPQPESVEDATPEQQRRVEQITKQIDELEKMLSLSNIHIDSEEEYATKEQLARLKELEKQIEKFEALNIQHDIVDKLKEQHQKLDEIENNLKKPKSVKKTKSKSTKKAKSSKQTKSKTTEIGIQAYCVKCRTKREIKDPQETTMKNGRAAIKGTCSICNCKVFRIGKIN